MTTFVAIALWTSAVLAAGSLGAPQINITVAANGTAQTNPKTALQFSEKNETDPQTSTVASQVHQALKPNGEDLPEPSGSLSFVVYAAVLITIIAMIYLVVRNFRMRYDTARAERYGFRLRRGRTDEVQPLSRDDEDEEILFDVRGNLR